MSGGTELIERSHFTTSALEERHRFDAWKDSISVLFDVAPTAQTIDVNFDADVQSFMVGSLMAAKCRCRVQTFERSQRTIARDGMDHLLVQFYRVGGNIIKTRDDFVEVGPGDIQIVDMAQELKTFAHDQGHLADARPAGREFENVSLIIARDRLEPLVPSVHGLHLTLLRAGTPLNTILRTYIMNLYSGADSLTREEADRLVKPTAELLAATLGQVPDVVEQARDTLNEAVLLAVKKFIERHLANPALGPEMISKAMGISRTGLFRACAPLGGVMAFIRERRLLKARRLLCRPAAGASVKRVAYALGFSDPSSFARAFRRQFGYAPAETRDLHRAGAESWNRPGGADRDPVGDRNYEYWMMNLVM